MGQQGLNHAPAWAASVLSAPDSPTPCLLGPLPLPWDPPLATSQTPYWCLCLSSALLSASTPGPSPGGKPAFHSHSSLRIFLGTYQWCVVQGTRTATRLWILQSQMNSLTTPPPWTSGRICQVSLIMAGSTGDREVWEQSGRRCCV